MDKYDHAKIEKKWQSAWLSMGIYEPDLSKSQNPFYNLMMFPYPSAEGLHVGNIYAFTGSDIYGRYMRMRGFDVFEPIGLDGFGIHSENYALKIGQHPMELAKKTEANFYRQLRQTGNAYYWSNKLETYKSNYYKWTQWIFIQMFKAGLAYRAKSSVNWCPSCLTVLADEQVINRKHETGDRKQETVDVCERCGTQVVRKELDQWFFRITDYAQRLLDGLDKIDWSEKVKVAQRNWLGKSEGVEIMFPCDIDKKYFVNLFTTRIDTIFGMTFMALAPQHPLVTEVIARTKGLLRQQISQYVAASVKKGEALGIGGMNTESESRAEAVKTGIFTGFYAKNPVSGRKIPIYIADYVLASYGTGAIMGVPAHDQRDWEFAKKYGIDIVEVVRSSDGLSQNAFTGEGMLINSGKYTGLSSKEAIQRLTKYIIKNRLGSQKTTWHLRDWVISRQRYWGPPIPIIYCRRCWEVKSQKLTRPRPSRDEVGKVKSIEGKDYAVIAGHKYAILSVPEEDLPVELPYIKNFKPTGTGVSPLSSDSDFVKVKCPQCGSEARRETDVSDTFLDSAWYFLRYPSVGMENKQSLRSSQNAVGLGKWKMENSPWSREVTRKWLPVDMYIGGAEHAVLHLLYSRFLTMVFKNLGLVEFEEPFTKFRAHGLLISGGAKMSKSKGNIVLPDAYIEKYGADTLRCYLMFCGRFTQGGDFRDSGIEGMHRFLNRVWRLVQKNFQFPISNFKLSSEAAFMMHKTIRKVTEDIESLDYNTAIAAIMEWVNFLEEKEVVTGKEIEVLLLLLAPFASHMTEELWQIVHSSEFTVHGNDQKNTVDRQLKAKRTVNWSIHKQPWPKYDPKLAEAQEIVLVVEVNGRVRDKITVTRGIGREEAQKLALASEKVTKYLQKGKPKKVIFVPDRLINFVV